MSLIRRLELFDPFYFTESTTSIFNPKTLAFPSLIDEEIYDFDLFTPKSTMFDSVTDLIKVTEAPLLRSYRRVVVDESPLLYRKIQRRVMRTELSELCDRVAELECRFEKALRVKRSEDRKYTLTAEIEGPETERKYKWTAEMKGGKKKEEKWTAEINRKGEEGRKYKWTAEIKGAGEDGDDVKEENKAKEEKKKTKKKESSKTRVVEIQEEPADHGTIVLRQAFQRRPSAIEKVKGKRKELSPQDAAMMIQITFRAYLIRRSKALRALRELAVAKSKLKEIRALFNNFSYRRRVSQDAEERQRFSEKIIVVLLTVDAIEGADLMVRGAKRSMIDELEAMLDAVDPQPAGRSLSMRRRQFDMPNGVIRKEIAEGVAQVVQMLDEEENTSSTFEACL